MTPLSGLWRWAAASNERAVTNARLAATECSRARVERAEVEQFLRAYAGSTTAAPAKVASTAR